MSRTADQVAEGLRALRPLGFASAADPDTYVAAHDRATAEEWARLETSAEALLAEIDLRQAVYLLPDYERVLGPDPCGRDQLALTDADRRTLAYQRWTRAATVCAGYFEGMAAELGIALTVQEFPLSYCDTSVCGDELVPWPRHCDFLVTLPATRTWDAICGDAVAADPLGGFTGNLMECVIRAESPLHAAPYFSYV